MISDEALAQVALSGGGCPIPELDVALSNLIELQVSLFIAGELD